MNIQLSKIEVAKRQLITAISLYFNNGDEVSIYTLASASYNVLRDVNKKAGRSTYMKDKFLYLFKEEDRKCIRKVLNKSENFFKHAETDPEHLLDFNPEESEWTIFESCIIFTWLIDDKPALFKKFQTWFMLNNPRLFVFNIPESQQEKFIEAGNQMINYGREFFMAHAPKDFPWSFSLDGLT